MNTDSAQVTHVLVVEDDPQDAALYSAMLRSTKLTERFEVVVVGRLSECIALLETETPACVLLDMGLPDAEGVEGIARIRFVAPDVPVVVLTGTDDETVGLHALQRGAQDYLVKGVVDSHGLVRSIRYAIERMKADEGTHLPGVADPLTAIANRTIFADRLHLALDPFETPGPVPQKN
jgi:two-component system, cell cycle response regulator